MSAEHVVGAAHLRVAHCRFVTVLTGKTFRCFASASSLFSCKIFLKCVTSWFYFIVCMPLLEGVY